VRVLGAYQPAGSAPYDDPVWGADQAREFISQHADVIFAAGGTTGQGALAGATQSGVGCINEDLAASVGPGCLLATSLKFVDRGVQMAVTDAMADQWRSGVRSLGLAEHAVGLSLRTDPRLTPQIRGRIQTIADLLAAGSLATQS
jgi:basic membrane protein A